MELKPGPDYYQFMLSFGILGGASSSLIWTSSIATVGHWFLDRRGLATGLATTAGPVGGVVFPLVIQKLIPAIGFAWAVRVIGFICLGLGLVGISLMKTRLPPDRSVKRAFNLRGFKDIRFILTILAMFAIDWAVLIPPAYLTTYALAKGVNSSLSYQLLVILNTTQIFGRALPGLIADRWGRFNTMILSSLACTIAILALWLRAGSNVGAIIGFAALYGLFSGTAYSLTPVCVSQLCETEEYASRYGTAYGFISIATLAGIPASGAILGGGGGGGGSGQDDGEGFRGLILTCGMAYLASTVLFTLARGVGGGWKVQKVY